MSLPVTPTDSAARERAVATVIAGKASLRRGWRRLPQTLVGCRPHFFTHSCTHTRVLTQCTQVAQEDLRVDTLMHFPTHAPHMRRATSSRSATPVLRRRRTFHTCCGCDLRAQAICSSRRHAPCRQLPPCSGYHPMGSEGVVEPGARAVGANGIERCPPHVYP